MKLVLTCLSLILLNGCGQKTVYIGSKEIETFFIPECKSVRIVPNSDGSLGVENHAKLYETVKCHKEAHHFYRQQLLTMRG